MTDNPKTQQTEKTQASEVVEAVTASDIFLFHTPDQTAYAEIIQDNTRVSVPVNGGNFFGYVHRLAYTDLGLALGVEVKNTVISILSAKAMYDGPEEDVFYRVGQRLDGTVEFDLANETGSVVHISKSGWSIIEPTLKFRRTRNIKPLPTPARGGKINTLWQFVNVVDPEDQALLLAWLVGCFRPSGPYPILTLQAEKGSGKTTAMRFIRGLVDPSKGDTRSLPRTEQDLFIAANDNWVLSYDNLVGLRGDVSDMFCRMATGGAFATRKLYTNDTESMIEMCRPVTFNGIEDIGSRADLISRSITITLPKLPNTNRLALDDLEELYEAERPRLLGVLLDAASKGFQHGPDVELEETPRMADFAKFATATEPVLGIEKGAIVAAMIKRQKEQDQDAVLMDIVATKLISLLDQIDGGSWSGTMTELHDRLTPERPPRAWPMTAKVLSQKLHHLEPQLREVGVEMEWKKGTERIFSVWKSCVSSVFCAELPDLEPLNDEIPF